MRIAFDSFENWKVGEGVRGVERAGRCDRRCFSGWWLTRCMTKRPSPPFGHESSVTVEPQPHAQHSVSQTPKVILSINLDFSGR